MSGSDDNTQLVRVPKPERRRERSWKPFRFSGLEKVSRGQALLVERVNWLLPGINTAGQAPADALSRLKQLLVEEVTLRLDAIHVLQPKDLKRVLANPTVMGMLVPAPQQTRGFLEVELSLAHAIVDVLLGGAGEMIALRPLSDIEEGVLSFVLIETLKCLAPYVHPGLPRIRLEGMARGVEQVVAAVAGEKQVAVVQLRATVGKHAGYLRLFLPETVLALANPPAEGPERKLRRSLRARQHGARLKGVMTSLRAEIGSFELGSADLLRLGEKDVVSLMEPLNFRPDRGEVGATKLRVGNGRVGYVNATVQLEAGRYQAVVNEIVSGEQPQAASHPAAAPGGEKVEEAKTDGAELLGDIPLQVTVELGRVAFSAEEVVSLHVGQIIDLNRVPNEPVELSVHGKVVARGELVEVEGQVGVRILSLVR